MKRCGVLVLAGLALALLAATPAHASFGEVLRYLDIDKLAPSAPAQYCLRGVTFDGTYLYVINIDGSRVYKIIPTGSGTRDLDFATPLFNTFGLGHNNANLWLTVAQTNIAYAYDWMGNPTGVSWNFTPPAPHSYYAGTSEFWTPGTSFWVIGNNNPSSIFRISTTNGAVLQSLTHADWNNPAMPWGVVPQRALGYDPVTNTFFTSGLRNHQLWNFNATTGANVQTPVSLHGSQDLTIDRATPGNPYLWQSVMCQRNRVFCLDPNLPALAGRPATPTGLTAVTAGDTVKLTWVNPGTGPTVVGIGIYRDGVIIDTVAAGTTTFNDLPTFGAYDYYVQSYNGVGWSGRSNRALGISGEPVYNQNFDAGSGGYSATGCWQWGVPSSGPMGAYSTPDCWATVLGGDYPNSTNSQLTSPSITLPDPNYYSGCRLYIMHWYDTDGYDGLADPRGQYQHDGGNVKISVGGGAWTIISPADGYDISNLPITSSNAGIPGQAAFSGSYTGWHLSRFDLGASLGQNIQLRLDFGSDGAYTKPGWYVDNIVIVSTKKPVHDVGVIDINGPPDIVTPNVAAYPGCVVKNFGSQKESFDVECDIRDQNGTLVYSQTEGATLDPQQVIDVDFLDWKPGAPGTVYSVTFFTLLAGDIDPSNDEMSKTCTSAWTHDLAAIQVIDPVPDGEIDALTPVTPKATFANLGLLTESNAPVACIIDSIAGADTFVVYVQSATIASIASGETTEVSFPTWPGGGLPGGSSYHVTFLAQLPNEAPGSQANDTVVAVFRTRVAPGVEEGSTLPDRVALTGCAPIPFHASVTIRYQLPHALPVGVRVYDLTGQLVRTLVDGTQAAGYRSVRWNGCDHTGRALAPGIYFVRFDAGSYTATRKVILSR